MESNAPAKTAQMSTSDLLRMAAERAEHYVQTIDERRVAPSNIEIAALSRFHEPFPKSSTDPRDVLTMLDELGSPAESAVPPWSVPAVLGRSDNRQI